VHGLETLYGEQIRFTYLDRDDPANQPFLAELGFRYQPEFYLLDADGNITWKWIGPADETAFVEALEQALA
jgi:hypothetical protein